MQQQRLGKLINEDQRINFEGVRDLHKLHNIQPPLPGLVLGDERLRLAQSLRHLLLCNAGTLARGLKPSKQLLVLPQMS